jgi:hypothetical protein
MERMSEREREPGGGIEERGGHVNFIPIISFRFFPPSRRFLPQSYLI